MWRKQHDQVNNTIDSDLQVEQVCLHGVKQYKNKWKSALVQDSELRFGEKTGEAQSADTSVEALIAPLSVSEWQCYGIRKVFFLCVHIARCMWGNVVVAQIAAGVCGIANQKETL